MNRLIVLLAAVMLLAEVGLQDRALHAATINPPETFDSGTANGWTTGVPSAEPEFQPDGGPNGAGDPFLLLTSTGGNGPGSRLAVYHDGPDWTGDFQTSSVTGLSVDLQNPTSSVPLQMRLVLFGPQSTSNRWTSTEPLSVANDGQWHSYFFPIDEQSFRRVQGTSTYAQATSQAVRIMLRHDPGTASSTGAAVRAQLGMDNIALVGKLFGDYNDNGLLDAGDLDLLTEGMIANDLAFDLDGDGDADFDDRLVWIHDLQNSWVGDANFDGEFNSKDLISVFLVGKYETTDAATYAEGDWDGNQLFGSGDMIAAFLDGGFEVGPRPATVPEPTSGILLVIGTFFGMLQLRGRSIRRE